MDSNLDYNQLFKHVQDALLIYQHVKMNSYTSKDIRKSALSAYEGWIDKQDLKEYIRKDVSGGVEIQVLKSTNDKQIDLNFYSTNKNVELIPTKENSLGFVIKYMQRRVL